MTKEAKLIIMKSFVAELTKVANESMGKTAFVGSALKGLSKLKGLKGLLRYSDDIAKSGLADDFAKAMRQAKIDAAPRYSGPVPNVPNTWMSKAERKAAWVNHHIGNQGGRFRVPKMDKPPKPNKLKNTTKQKDMFDVDLNETSPQGFNNLFDDPSQMILD